MSEMVEEYVADVAADMRPGDLIAYADGTLASRAIRWATRADVSHADAGAEPDTDARTDNERGT